MWVGDCRPLLRHPKGDEEHTFFFLKANGPRMLVLVERLEGKSGLQIGNDGREQPKLARTMDQRGQKRSQGEKR